MFDLFYVFSSNIRTWPPEKRFVQHDSYFLYMLKKERNLFWRALCDVPHFHETRKSLNNYG